VSASGVTSGCTACAASSAATPLFCPGLTAAPIVTFAYGLPAAYSAVCKPLVGAGATLVTAPAASTSRFTFVTGLPTVDGVILAGIVAISALAFVYCSARSAQRCGGAGCLSRFQKVDIFNKEGWVPDGSPLEKKNRPIGGFYSMAGVIAFATAAGVLIATRADSNVTTVQSASILNSANEALVAALPFAADASWGRGVTVRVAASGAPGKCANASVVASGFSTNAAFAAGGALAGAGTGAWAQSATAACGSSGASQLVFSCATCSLSSKALITLTFHYSCQAFDVQVGALDALGTLSVVEAAASAEGLTMGSGIGARLGRFDVTADLFYSVLNDTRSAAASLRGYGVANAAGKTTTASFRPFDDQGGPDSAALPQGPPGTTMPYVVAVPSGSAVTVTVALTLNNVYATTVLSEKQSVAALLASIAGLASIVGLAAKVMSINDSIERIAAKRAAARVGAQKGDGVGDHVQDGSGAMAGLGLGAAGAMEIASAA